MCIEPPKIDAEEAPLFASSDQVDLDCMVVDTTAPKRRKKKQQQQQALPLPEAAEATDTSAKPARQDSSAVSFKNGKIAFSEKKLGLERHPSVVAAVFKFHQLIAQLKQENRDSLPLSTISAEHHTLIAMMVQERDVTIASLVKSIEAQLCPVVFGAATTSNSDILAPGTVESAIVSIADHKNYGVLLDDLKTCCQIDLGDVPNSLSIQRWEVRDLSLFPEDVREIVLKRRSARENAHSECVQWFRSLNAEIQTQILAGTLKKLKIKAQPTAAAATATVEETAAVPMTGQSLNITDTVVEVTATGNMPGLPTSPKKQPHNLHLLRGQQSLQSFFTKDKGAEKTKRQNVASHETGGKSYYATVFLPFHVRINTAMFRYQPSPTFEPSRIDAVLGAAPSGQIVCDRRGDSEMRAHLNEFAACPRKFAARPVPAIPVSDGFELDEAELYQWRLRQIPMKLIHFHGSRRPAYWGTWSRQLRNVSGRRPFAQDTSELDYDVDSDAEWEVDEGEGEDLHSEDDEDNDDEDNEDDDDDDEDDEDFDEENGFIVGDNAPRSHFGMQEQADTGSQSDGDDDDSDSESDSEFVSEDEVIEEIDASEEVCSGDMDVDEPAECADGTDKLSIIKTVRSRRKVSFEERPQNQTDLHTDPQPRQRQRRRQRVQLLTPVVIGLVWDEINYVDLDNAGKYGMLTALAVTPIETTLPLHISTNPGDIQPTRQKESASKVDNPTAPLPRKGNEVSDKEFFALVSVVHGSSLGVLRLVEELKAQIPHASKAHIERLIHEHAVKEKRPPTTRPLWYVSAELVQQAQAARQSNEDAAGMEVEAVVAEKKCKPGLVGGAGDTRPVGRHVGRPTDQTDDSVLADNAAKRQRIDGSTCEA
ncbi:hypothetical protein LPJ66_008685 [Kickxella alabastrina]|uniref:Uncharacterized protein n=1 Tax=Kickxella alabastrina TaxID=61397 RepID=A0ACC1I911_9FUNG|nr:hypothetical protein LPJ66_008685 [Kickxella alabastrina]